MIKNNFPSDEIMKIRSLLLSDGWKEINCLPSQWMFKLDRKQRGQGNCLFIDQEGNLYKSKEKVKRHFQRRQNFNALSRFNEFLKNKPKGSYYKGTRDQETIDGWLVNDPSVPPGWRIRNKMIWGTLKATQLLSPNDKYFEGRRTALKFMVEDKYPDEEITAMRNSLLSQCGWLKDPQLPTNWLYKFHKSSSGSVFLDSKGKSFRSRMKAKEYY